VTSKNRGTRRANGWESRAVERAKRLLAERETPERQSAIQVRLGGNLVAVADWAVTTCLAAGSSVHTAYLVAGTLAQGLADAAQEVES
jgi:hypothetical protein